MPFLLSSVKYRFFLPALGLMLAFSTFSPFNARAQTYLNDDSTAADLDDDAVGEEHQAFRHEHYNDLIANLEISTQSLEQAQQMGQSGEAMHDRRKDVKKYLKLIKKQIEDISELSDQSEVVENELQQMKNAKAEAEAALEDREMEDY